MSPDLSSSSTHPHYIVLPPTGQIDLEKKASADKVETLRADHSRELAAAGRDTDRGTDPPTLTSFGLHVFLCFSESSRQDG